MHNADLLGCICLYDEHKEYHPSDDIVPIEIIWEQGYNEPSSIACERLENEENKRPDSEVIGIEAWSNGLLRIWFRRI
jgi:hypothetical protein